MQDKQIQSVIANHRNIMQTENKTEELSEYEKFRQLQIEQFEDDITEGRCYPEMPEGQFVRSK